MDAVKRTLEAYVSLMMQAMNFKSIRDRDAPLHQSIEPGGNSRQDQYSIMFGRLAARGRCESCGELIGDGIDWRKAIYHHIRLVSDVTVSDKEGAPANCMVLHPECHDDYLNFYKLHGFSPDNLKRR
jgi:HNH endonuclease